MAARVTIRVSAKTKERLDFLKVHPGETHGKVVTRLTDLAIDDEPLSAEDLAAIEEGLEDVRAGRVRPLEEVMRELDLLD